MAPFGSRLRMEETKAKNSANGVGRDSGGGAWPQKTILDDAGWRGGGSLSRDHLWEIDLGQCNRPAPRTPRFLTVCGWERSWHVWLRRCVLRRMIGLDHTLMCYVHLPRLWGQCFMTNMTINVTRTNSKDLVGYLFLTRRGSIGTRPARRFNIDSPTLGSLTVGGDSPAMPILQGPETRTSTILLSKRRTMRFADGGDTCGQRIR